MTDIATINTLRANLSKLPAKDVNFATSLLNSWNDGIGQLSEKQLHWVRILADRAMGAPVVTSTPAAAPVQIDLSGAIALLDKAAENLKHPRLLVRTAHGDLRLTIAGPESKAPGTVNVTSAEGGWDNRVWYGRVTRAGVYEGSRKVPADQHTTVIAALQALVADPAGVAAAYGHETGSCCFCARELTDERSVRVGYGPICAGYYGLPWGDEPAAQASF